MAGGPLPPLPLLGVLTSKLLLMHSPHHCSSAIMWICCILTACHTTTSSLMFSSILWIGSATVWLATCGPHEVNLPLIQRIFAFQYNITVPVILISTSTFLIFLWPTLLCLPLLKMNFLTFPVATLLILRLKQFFVDALLIGNCQIYTFRWPFIVPMIFLLPMRHLVA